VAEPEAGFLIINERTRIPRGELWFEFSHSGGPGGQNVNKVSSRATVCLGLDGSPSLTDGQKRRIRAVLHSRVNRDGILRVSCDESRSQSYNREAAQERLRELLAAALHRPKHRKKTKPTRASQERRIGQKKQRSAIKRERRSHPEE
jgi:ribosome-associated protein